MNLTARGKHLLDYWSIIVRRRWVIYVALATVSLVSLIGSFLVTPLYRATATLQIERQNPDILTFQDLSSMDYSWAAYSDFYQTQYRIIASSAVARSAAERLALVSHPDFGSEARRPGLLARWTRWLPRKGAVSEVDPLTAAAGRILGSLEVSPVNNSQLVHVSWVADEPGTAADIANAVAQAYIQFNIQTQYATTDQAQEFLVDQITQLKREIRTLEQSLQGYGESKGIVAIDDANNITLQALQAIATRLTQAETVLAHAEAGLRAVLESDPEALPEVRDSDLISRLRQEYATYEAEHSEKSRRFRDDWPGMQTLGSKLDQSRRRLELETDRIVTQVRATREAEHREAAQEVANLRRLLERQAAAAQTLKRDAVEFANYQIEVDKKRETLDALLTRRNEMALSSRLKDLDATSTNIRIVELAQPPTIAFRPNTKLNVVLGLLAGLGLGLGLALFLEYLDNTIANPADLEKVVDLPLLAMIPRHGELPTTFPKGSRRDAVAAAPVDFVSQLDGRSPTSEAYRELRTSILLSSPGHPPRQIMVTSAVPGEGKTSTAINLALVLAQLGRKVILIDTDLRRPRLHKAFDAENQLGVSTYLSGLEADPASVIRKTDFEFLDLMPSGPIPPNPSELLNSATFAGLGQALADLGYDHMIFDSPPALSVSDPVIISAVVDTRILVVRAGDTPRQSVRLAAERFRQSNSGAGGIVLNDVRRTQRGPYYRYHYYGQNDDAEKPERRADRRRPGGVSA